MGCCHCPSVVVNDETSSRQPVAETFSDHTVQILPSSSANADISSRHLSPSSSELSVPPQTTSLPSKAFKLFPFERTKVLLLENVQSDRVLAKIGNTSIAHIEEWIKEDTVFGIEGTWHYETGMTVGGLLQHLCEISEAFALKLRQQPMPEFWSTLLQEGFEQLKQNIGQHCNILEPNGQITQRKNWRATCEAPIATDNAYGRMTGQVRYSSLPPQPLVRPAGETDLTITIVIIGTYSMIGFQQAKETFVTLGANGVLASKRLPQDIQNNENLYSAATQTPSQKSSLSLETTSTTESSEDSQRTDCSLRRIAKEDVL